MPTTIASVRSAIIDSIGSPSFVIRLATMSAAALVAVLIPIVILFIRIRTSSTYSLDHAILNTTPPTTLWMNMGYWKDTKSFPEACAALFRILVARGNIVPDLDILDIGCGCGDSTHLLSQLKPRSLRGITSEPTQSEISRQRFPDIEFIQADAVDYVSSLPKESVDRILALDCVYHFSSRTRFLEEGFRVLRPEGKIVMTDLMLGNSQTRLQRILLRVMCFLTGSPYANFRTRRDYNNELIQTGLADFSIEDISESVFPGLRDFVIRHRNQMGRFGLSGSWTGYLVFGKVLDWWIKANLVRFIVVNVHKNAGKKDV